MDRRARPCPSTPCGDEEGPMLEEVVAPRPRLAQMTKLQRMSWAVWPAGVARFREGPPTSGSG